MISVRSSSAASPGLLGDVALAWIGSDSLCRILVTSGLTVMWTNSAGAAALLRGAHLTTLDGRLATSDAAQQPEFAQFVEAACCEPSCWALRKPDDDGYVVFNAQRLGDDGGRLIGLTFRMDVPESDATRYRGLGEAFGLTNAESKVLARLLDGRMAEEAAIDLGVGIETIRSHIRQIYGKLAVRSREAMFRQVLPFFR